MHIAVDAANLLSDRRGIGVYVRAVLSRLLQQNDCTFTLLTRFPLPILTKRRMSSELHASDFSVSPGIPRSADVTWHPWNGTFFLGCARNVPTVHDVAPFAFPSADRAKRDSEQEPFRRSAAIARHMLTDSEFTRSEIEKYLGFDPDRITVAPLAADDLFAPGEPRALPADLKRGGYVVYVGTLERHKNVDALIDGWRHAAIPGLKLAIVGPAAPPSDVVSLKDLSPVELRDLYRGSFCVAVPSLYEGFGLPALEAMASGAPVIVSRRASLPEVCGDAALYVDEAENPQAWCDALVRLYEDRELRESLVTRGPVRAARFSWERTADQTLAILKQAAL